MISVTSVEAQNGFGKLLDMAQREPVTVTRHGRPAAFIVSPQDMDDLMNVRARRSLAVAALEAWSARAASQTTPAAGGLSGEQVNRLVHELR